MDPNIPVQPGRLVYIIQNKTSLLPQNVPSVGIPKAVEAPAQNNTLKSFYENSLDLLRSPATTPNHEIEDLFRTSDVTPNVDDFLIPLPKKLKKNSEGPVIDPKKQIKILKSETFVTPQYAAPQKRIASVPIKHIVPSNKVRIIQINGIPTLINNSSTVNIYNDQGANSISQGKTIEATKPLSRPNTPIRLLNSAIDANKRLRSETPADIKALFNNPSDNSGSSPLHGSDSECESFRFLKSPVPKINTACIPGTEIPIDCPDLNTALERSSPFVQRPETPLSCSLLNVLNTPTRNTESPTIDSALLSFDSTCDQQQNSSQSNATCERDEVTAKDFLDALEELGVDALPVQDSPDPNQLTLTLDEVFGSNYEAPTEAQHAEFSVIKEPQTIKEAQTNNKAKIINKAQTIKEAQIINKAQTINKTQTINKASIKNKTQTINKASFIKDAQIINKAKIIKDAQTINKAQFIKEAQTINKPKIIKDAQTINKAQFIKEAQTINKPKIIKDAQTINKAQFIKEAQTINKAKIIKEAQTINKSQFIKEAQTINKAKIIKEAQTINKAKIIKDAQTINKAKIIKEAQTINKAQFIKEAQTINKAPILCQVPILYKYPNINKTLLKKQFPNVIEVPALVEEVEVSEEPEVVEEQEIIDEGDVPEVDQEVEIERAPTPTFVPLESMEKYKDNGMNRKLLTEEEILKVKKILSNIDNINDIVLQPTFDKKTNTLYTYKVVKPLDLRISNGNTILFKGSYEEEEEKKALQDLDVDDDKKMNHILYPNLFKKRKTNIIEPLLNDNDKNAVKEVAIPAPEPKPEPENPEGQIPKSRFGREVKLPQPVQSFTEPIIRPKRKPEITLLPCLRCPKKFRTIWFLQQHYELHPSHMPNSAHRQLFLCFQNIINEEHEPENKALVLLKQLEVFITKLKLLVPCILTKLDTASVAKSYVIKDDVARLFGVDPGNYKVNADGLKCYRQLNRECEHTKPKIVKPIEPSEPVPKTVSVTHLIREYKREIRSMARRERNEHKNEMMAVDKDIPEANLKETTNSENEQKTGSEKSSYLKDLLNSKSILLDRFNEQLMSLSKSPIHLTPANINGQPDKDIDKVISSVDDQRNNNSHNKVMSSESDESSDSDEDVISIASDETNIDSNIEIQDLVNDNGNENRGEQDITYIDDQTTIHQNKEIKISAKEQPNEEVMNVVKDQDSPKKGVQSNVSDQTGKDTDVDVEVTDDQLSNDPILKDVNQNKEIKTSAKEYPYEEVMNVANDELSPKKGVQSNVSDQTGKDTDVEVTDDQLSNDPILKDGNQNKKIKTSAKEQPNKKVMNVANDQLSPKKGVQSKVNDQTGKDTDIEVTDDQLSNDPILDGNQNKELKTSAKEHPNEEFINVVRDQPSPKKCVQSNKSDETGKYTNIEVTVDIVSNDLIPKVRNQNKEIKTFAKEHPNEEFTNVAKDQGVQSNVSDQTVKDPIQNTINTKVDKSDEQLSKEDLNQDVTNPVNDQSNVHPDEEIDKLKEQLNTGVVDKDNEIEDSLINVKDILAVNKEISGNVDDLDSKHDEEV